MNIVLSPGPDRTGSVQTVPFLLSASIHTGPIRYQSSTESTRAHQLFLPIKHAQMYKVVSKCAVETKTGQCRCSHGTGPIWDRNGSKIGPAESDLFSET